MVSNVIKFRDDGFKSIQKTATFKTWGRINGHVKEVIAHFYNENEWSACWQAVDGDVPHYVGYHFPTRWRAIQALAVARLFRQDA